MNFELVKKIHVNKYRKIENIDFEFAKGVNVISGTNGTCKTSLLHIISNSFQAVTKKCNWIKDASCLDIIRQVNNMMNPKIETLAKGDKSHNDPANGVKGTIFSVDYYEYPSMRFRCHNSKLNNRYAVKPWYRKGTSEKLPFCPVIYLGLARLYSFGEYLKDETVKNLRKNLPTVYQDEISNIYKELTGINISSVNSQKMGDIKVRADFDSDIEGIDSNTISSGEDNLFIIITALMSLKYYFQNIETRNEIESILLIDEFDATIHPSLQEKLLKIFRKFSVEYKIQIVITTHSLSTVESSLKNKDNVIYLIDNITNILIMESPDIYKIKRHLSGITGDDIYLNKSIPLFTEDEEARLFLKILFEYYSECKEGFSRVRSYFHFVNANIGATNLIAIFKDKDLLQTAMKSICILDGDQHTDLNNYIITLPGDNSPEKVIMDYVQTIYNTEASFWVDSFILDLNYGKVYFRDTVKPELDKIDETLAHMAEIGESRHGKERDMRKKVFKKYERFFEFLFKYWVRDKNNLDNVNEFYKNLNIMFKKVAEFHGINPKIWSM